MNEFRVIIAGSREYSDYETLKDTCDYLLSEKANLGVKIIIISGHAKGADTLGEQYAQERGYDCEIYPAEWDKYGKSAGYKRNVTMAEHANACIAFFKSGAKNIGTQLMVNIAKEKGLEIREIKKEEGN